MAESKPQLPAEVYARVFVNHAEGAQILEELIQRFENNPFVRGGHEADRQTAFNCGQMNVTSYITSRINQASIGATDDDHANA